jgi:hypothetical protein
MVNSSVNSNVWSDNNKDNILQMMLIKMRKRCGAAAATDEDKDNNG